MTHAPRRLRWILAVLLTGQFMANVDTAIVNVAGPSIHAGLHTSPGELELAVSGYILAYAMLLITGARLGDIRGHRRVFAIGLGLFTVASLACGLAPDPIALVLARVAQGAGAALMVPQVLSGIQLNFSGPGRARALGSYAVALSGGAVAGQVLGGLLISADLLGSGWRSIFLINVPIGVVLMAAALRLLPADSEGRSEGRARRLDLGGVAILSTAMLLAILPLVLGRDEGWPAWTWACLAASLPAFVLFVAFERRLAGRGGYPLVNVHVLAQPTIGLGLLAIGAATGTYFALLFTVALYLQQGLGWSPFHSGLALVSWVAAFGIAGPLFSRLPARVGPLVTPAGPLLLAAAYLAISVATLTGGGAGALLIVLLGLGGLGLGANFSGLVAHLTSAVDPRYAPDLSGAIPTSSQIAAVIGVAGFGTAYLGLSVHSANGAFATVTACMGATAIVAAVACYLSIRSAGSAGRPGDGQARPGAAETRQAESIPAGR